MINWCVSPESWHDIIAIVERIEADLKPTDDRRTIVMDITACHANGCPLRLKELLTANKADFSHDYYGIRQHINRETGMLEDSFTPRYAAPQEQSV